MPDAQLRATVRAGIDCGTPARSARTRATFAWSKGCPTQPKITSSRSAGSMPVRASSSRDTRAPRCPASSRLYAPPAFAWGALSPAAITIRGPSCRCCILRSLPAARVRAEPGTAWSRPGSAESTAARGKRPQSADSRRARQRTARRSDARRGKL